MSIPIIDTLSSLGNFPVVDSSEVQAGSVRLDVSLNNKVEKTYVDSELSKKVNVVAGKGLSTNDFTNEEKNKISDIQSDLSNKSDKSYVESELNKKADKTTTNSLSSRMTNVETEQSTLNSRMDSFTTLTEGSTTGDAELADARIAADGKTYDNVGNSIRGQVTDLKNDFSMLNIIDVENPYSNWNNLVVTANTESSWGMDKIYNSGYVQSIRLKLKESASNSKIHIVELDDSGKYYKCHSYTFSNSAGIKDIDINEYFEKDFYVFTNAPIAYAPDENAEYNGGLYQGPSKTQFPKFIFNNKYQFAIAVVRNYSYNNNGIIKTTNDFIHGNRIVDGITPIDFNSKVYDSVSDTSIWVSSKVYKKGFLKSVNCTVPGETDQTCNVYLYKSNNDGTYTTFASSSASGHGDVPVSFNINVDSDFLIGVQGKLSYFEDGYYKTYKSGTVNGSKVTPATHCNTYYAHKYYVVMGNESESIINENKRYTLEDVGIRPLRIAFIGDSIVEGYGSSDYNGGSSGTSGHLIPNTVKTWYRNTGSKCWTNSMISYLTETYPDITACNNGIGGFTSQQLYDNLGTLTLCDDGNQADIVIMSIGTNDIDASDKAKSITTPISKSINWMKNKGITPIVLTNSPLIQKNGFKNDMNIHSAIVRAAENSGVHVYDVMSEVKKYLWQNNIALVGELDQNHYMYDLLHPSDIGYKAMFNIIKYLLKV